MIGQRDEAKMEKFVDTMPTIIQTHLVICENWEKTKDKAKELEYIIQKCEPPAAVVPTLAPGTSIPGLYSHIAQSKDKEDSEISPIQRQRDSEIPQPFKGVKPKQTKGKTRGKPKNNQSKSPKIYRYSKMSTTTKILIITTIQKTIGANHEAEGHIEVKTLADHSNPKITVVETSIIRTNFKPAIMVLITTQAIIKEIKGSSRMYVEGIIKATDTANLVAEAVAMAEEIIVHSDAAGVILEAIIIINTNNITPTIMIKGLNNMALHAHYVEVTTNHPNIPTRENMILMTSWKR